MDKFMDTSAEPDKQPEEEKQPAAERSEETAVQPTNEAESTPKQARRPRQRKPKGEGRRGRKGAFTVRQVADRFAACGRCSYFWAGYKVLCGEEAQETAVAQSESGWLDLAWHNQLPRLLYKSYGVRLDIDHFHYEGCCKECRRRFVYDAADQEEEYSSCAIEISPSTLR